MLHIPPPTHTHTELWIHAAGDDINTDPEQAFLHSTRYFKQFDPLQPCELFKCVCECACERERERTQSWPLSYAAVFSRGHIPAFLNPNGSFTPLLQPVRMNIEGVKDKKQARHRKPRELWGNPQWHGKNMYFFFNSYINKHKRISSSPQTQSPFKGHIHNVDIYKELKAWLEYIFKCSHQDDFFSFETLT